MFWWLIKYRKSSRDVKEKKVRENEGWLPIGTQWVDSLACYLFSQMHEDMLSLKVWGGKKPLILRHPEQVLARPSALWDSSKQKNFKPFWGWKKTRGENHKALAVKGERHPTCSLESNQGHSGERRACYHGATKPHNRQWSVLGLVAMSPLGLKARVGSLIHNRHRHMWCMYPQIHHWCNTCWPLSGQHGSQAILIHIHVNKHWLGFRLSFFRLTMWDQANALPTELCWLGGSSLYSNFLSLF